MKKTILLLSALLLATGAHAQKYDFNGLDMNMGTLSRLSNAKSRSISPENFTGEPGKGAMAKTSGKDGKSIPSSTSSREKP